MSLNNHLSVDPVAQKIVIAGALVLCLAGFALAIALIANHPLTSPRVSLHIFLGTGGAVALWLATNKEFRKSAFLLIGTYWIGVACITLINGGLRGPNLINFPLILVISSWILGVRPTILLAILTEVFVVGLLIIDDFGFKTEADYSNKVAYFIFLTAVISMTAIASVLARNGYLKKVKESHEIAAELADSEVQLKQNLAQLENLVKTRTAELALAKDNLWAMNEAQLIGRVGTYVTDIKTGLWQGSAVLDDIFGIDATFEKTIPNWNGLIAPEFRQELLDYYFEVIATQGNFHKEYQVVRPVDGKPCWVEALGEFSFDDLGKPASLRGTILDISERKAAQLELQTYQNHLEELVQQKTYEVHQQQEQLRDQELRFTLAVEGADEGIWDLNLITQERYHSPRMASMLGYTLDELPPAQEVWETLTHPEDYPQYHQKLLAHIQDAAVPFETVIRLRHKDGNWRWILSRGRATRSASGHATRISGTNSDITERMRIEELLRISEEKHRILLDESSDPIFSFEGGGRYSYVNAAFAKGVGKAQKDIVGRTLWDVFPKEEADRRFQFLRNIFEEGNEANLNVRIPSPVGDRFLITTAKPILNEQRQVISVICVSKDVTSIVEAEEAAKAANLTKSEFLANMSHEIRTPMNGVIGMVDILQQTALNSEQRRMLSTIANSSQTLLEILNDILDYSKIEAGKLTVERVPTHLEEVAQSVLQLMQGTATAKDITLQLTLSPELPSAIYSDPTRLRQVLLNLIGNAIKFSNAEVDSTASVTLTLDTGRLPDGHAAVLLHVRDWGIGMSTEVVAKLFIPFTQADASTARQFGGTGLGLSITNRLVRLMGGQITVKSSLGEGTEFIVALPLQEAPLTGVVSRPANNRLRLRGSAPSFDAAAASGQLILLAEDNETNRDVLREQLRLLGYCTDTAEDGQVALEKWRSGLYALLLTDCHMPHMDGFALARAIRAEEIPGSRLPIIAITANAMQGEDQRCLQAGMDDYLSKPLRLQELAPMLDKWLPLPGTPEESKVAQYLASQSLTDAGSSIGTDGPWETWNCGTLSQLIGDNRKLQERLLMKFLANGEKQIPAICEALKSCELMNAVALAHTFKSAARSVGALALGELCQQIETVGNADDTAACSKTGEGFNSSIYGGIAGNS
jgi:PAS domain S-box-containing protein